MIALAVEWASFFALYLLFAGEASGEECVAAALTGVLATALRRCVLRREGLGAVPVPARVALRTLGGLIRDCWIVGRALLMLLLRRSALRGRFTEIRFEAHGTDPRTEARRALVTAALSLAPNAFAVFAAPLAARGRMVLHRLVAPPPGESASPEDPAWPI